VNIAKRVGDEQKNWRVRRIAAKIAKLPEVLRKA
jgi:hypothetical protein